MNKLLYAFGFFILIFFIWLWTKVRTAEKLTYKLLTPETIRFNGLRLDWIQPVQITNPTNTGIFVKLIQFDVFVKGYLIGSGFTNQPLTISSVSQNVVRVPCGISILDLLVAVPSIISQAKTQLLAFDFVGNINAEGFTIGIETGINVPIPNLSFLKSNKAVQAITSVTV